MMEEDWESIFLSWVFDKGPKWFYECPWVLVGEIYAEFCSVYPHTPLTAVEIGIFLNEQQYPRKRSSGSSWYCLLGDDRYSFAGWWDRQGIEPGTVWVRAQDIYDAFLDDPNSALDSVTAVGVYLKSLGFKRWRKNNGSYYGLDHWPYSEEL